MMCLASRRPLFLLFLGLLWLAAPASADDPPTKGTDPLPIDDPTATRAQFQLAESLRMRSRLALANALAATTDKDREQAYREGRESLVRAVEEYEKLTQLLPTPDRPGPERLSARHLTPDERLQVPFTLAACRFDLGQYEKALKLYDALAEKHKGTVASLEAMGGAVRCHAALGQREAVASQLKELRGLLPGLPDEVVRKQWEAWIAIAEK
jgi:hypothetical protein